MNAAADDTALPVSLVIVSRHRPDALRRLLSALQFQTHRNFELIVVSDQPSLDGMALSDQARHHPFNEANISAARNIGLRCGRCGADDQCRVLQRRTDIVGHHCDPHRALSLKILEDSVTQCRHNALTAALKMNTQLILWQSTSIKETNAIHCQR